MHFVSVKFFGLPKNSFAQDQIPEVPLYIYLFYGEGCPHCFFQR